MFLASYGLPTLSFSTLSSCLIFDYHYLTARTSVGRTLFAANILNAVVCALYLAWVVERAKKCLDFASTYYIVHLLACWLHSAFPRSFIWWATNIIGLAIMTLLGAWKLVFACKVYRDDRLAVHVSAGEWLCMRREMAEIPMSALRRRPAAGGAEGASTIGGRGAISLELRGILTSGQQPHQPGHPTSHVSRVSGGISCPVVPFQARELPPTLQAVTSAQPPPAAPGPSAATSPTPRVASPRVQDTKEGGSGHIELPVSTMPGGSGAPPHLETSRLLRSLDRATGSGSISTITRTGARTPRGFEKEEQV